MDLEKHLNEKIPIDIVRVLDCCGFDNELSISAITSDTINEIENYVNENLSMLINTSDEGVAHFKLKPGHKSYILQLPSRMKRLKETTFGGLEKCKMSEFSYILQTFIETADANFDKQPNGVRHNETCRYFSVFVYLIT